MAFDGAASFSDQPKTLLFVGSSLGVLLSESEELSRKTKWLEGQTAPLFSSETMPDQLQMPLKKACHSCSQR